MASLDSVIQRLGQAKSVLSAPMTINASTATAVTANGTFQAQAVGGQVAAQVGGQGGGQGGNPNFAPDPNSGNDNGIRFGGEGTDSVYTEDRLVELVNEDVPGAGDPRLNELMEEMQTLDPNDRPAVEAMMTEIADIRGTDPDAMIADYDKMTDIMGQNGLTFDSINEDLHPDFMGSEVHLTYGNVVGNSIGLDPVFGAVMNPSGGLTGPGNNALPTDPNSAITSHGIVHDASGFMYNSLGIGHGYDYVENIPGAPWYLNDFLDDSNPLAGQWNGVAYWESIQNNNPLSVGLGTVGDFADLFTEGIDLGFEAGGNWLGDNVPIVGGLMGWGLEGAGNVVGGVGDWFDLGTDIGADFFNWTHDAAGAAWDGVTDWGSDSWDGFSDWGGDTWDSLSTWGGDTWSGVTDWGGDTWDGVSDWGSNTWSGVSEWGSDTWDSATDWDNWSLEGAGDWASDTWNSTTDWAGDTWSGASDWAGDSWNSVSDWGSETWDSGTDWASDSWDSVTDWGSDSWDGATDWASDTWDAGTDWASDSWNSATDLASDTWDGATDWGSDSWDSASDWAGDTWDSGSDWASDAWDSGSDWASDTWDSVSSWW